MGAMTATPKGVSGAEPAKQHFSEEEMKVVKAWLKQKKVGDQRQSAEELRAQLPELATKLREAPDWRSDGDAKLAGQEGVYLLLEKGQPMYVGVTTKLSQRKYSHGRLAANQGTYAFQLAIEEAERRGVTVTGVKKKPTRKEMEADGVFRPIFQETCRRVSEMTVHWIEVRDYHLMAMLEPYAARLWRLTQSFRPH
jgi:hypothetical protein